MTNSSTTGALLRLAEARSGARVCDPQKRPPFGNWKSLLRKSLGPGRWGNSRFGSPKRLNGFHYAARQARRPCYLLRDR